MKRFKITAVLIVLLLHAAGGYAADPGGSLESFAGEVVKAIRSKSKVQRMAVLHPKSLACINSSTQPYFDWIFSRQFRYQLPDTYRVSSAPLSGLPAIQPDKAVYPVTPTQQVQIDFTVNPTKSISIVVLAAHDGKRWREVLPCPTAEAVAVAKNSSVEKDRQNRRIHELASSLSAPLRAELLAMIKAGRRVDAIRRYAAVSGQELVIAKGVVDLLGEGM